MNLNRSKLEARELLEARGKHAKRRDAQLARSLPKRDYAAQLLQAGRYKDAADLFLSPHHDLSPEDHGFYVNHVIPTLGMSLDESENHEEIFNTLHPHFLYLDPYSRAVMSYGALNIARNLHDDHSASPNGLSPEKLDTLGDALSSLHPNDQNYFIEHAANNYNPSTNFSVYYKDTTGRKLHYNRYSIANGKTGTSTDFIHTAAPENIRNAAKLQTLGFSDNLILKKAFPDVDTTDPRSQPHLRRILDSHVKSLRHSPLPAPQELATSYRENGPSSVAITWADGHHHSDSYYEPEDDTAMTGAVIVHARGDKVHRDANEGPAQAETTYNPINGALTSITTKYLENGKHVKEGTARAFDKDGNLVSSQPSRTAAYD